MKLHTIIAAATLVRFSCNTYAGEYNPNFDEGVNISEFVTAATGKGSIQTHSPLPEISTAVVQVDNLKQELPASLAKYSLKPLSGYVVPPVSPRILKSEVYQSALMYPSLLQEHDSPTAYKLLGQWQSIVNLRAALVDEAVALDTRSSDLYEQALQINNDSHALQQEINDFNANVSQYNSQCANQPVNQACTDWSNRIDAWRKDILNKSAIQKKKVAKWNSDVSELKSSDNTWAIKVLSWENDINIFIKAAQDFLNGYTMCVLNEASEKCEIHTSTDPSHPLVYVTGCEYTCGTDGHWWGFLLYTYTPPCRKCPKVIRDGETPLKSTRRRSPEFPEYPSPGF